MEAYIPYSFPFIKPNKPWFSSACSRAIRRRNAAFRDYRRLQTPETHSTYISSRNRAKSILRDTKNSFIRRKCNNLSGSSSSRPFWHFAKNVNSNFASSSFSSLVSSDGTTAILPSTKAELFAQTFASNSTLDDSGAIPPPSTPSNSIMPIIRISSKDVISALPEFNTKKAYGPDGIPPVILKTCASKLAPCLGTLFRLCLSTSTFPSCSKRALIQPVKKKGTHLNPLITVQFLETPFFQKFSNLSLTGKFENISILLILSLIVSMTFVRNSLLVIFFPFSLTLGPPLFGISVNLLLSRWTYRKPLIEAGTTR